MGDNFDRIDDLPALRRRVNRARRFMVNTCPASRHLHTIASEMAAGRIYPMLDEEPVHCAKSMLSVLESLWKARLELIRLKGTWP
jgi:hypothetical protein